MTTPEYIIEFMRQGDYRFYIVTNGYDNDVIRQMQPCTVEDSTESLSKFFSNTTGQYRVKLYTSNELKRDGDPRQDPQVFEVQLTGKPLKFGGMGSVDEDEPFPPRPNAGNYNAFGGGFDGFGGASQGVFGFDKYDQMKDEILGLKERIRDLTNQIQFMQFKHETELGRLRDSHKLELDKASSNKELLGSGIGMLMNKMGMGE
jgi:hypothetical protein